MTQRVIVTGAAGLVGQNLIAQLARTGEFELVAVDKHPQNTSVLKRLHPQLQIITADLAEPGNWEEVAAGCADRLLHPVEANELFVRLTEAERAALRAQNFAFYDWGAESARFVTAWNTKSEDAAALGKAIAAL